MAIKTEAQLIANRVDSNVGVALDVIFEIATLLVPMLMKCSQWNQASAPTLKERLLKNKTSDGYSPDLLEEARHQTRRAARKSGHRHLSDDQLDAITTASFDHAIEADHDTLMACASESATIPDTDD